ncbi:hypothetical protein [Spirillospora sp. NPDC047279]|uniref:DUF7144 family membrane protein n=1 Tax=Spirillospora sp. NPDC047279 TaxID=3155478 RepID=UPI00340A4A21
MAASTARSTTGGPYSGWLAYAGMLGIVVGIFNVIEGFVALVKKDYFLTPGGELLVFDYNTWGWFWLIAGLLQIGVGLAVLAGQTWARVAGVVLAGLALIGQFAFLDAHPVWATINIAMLVLVIYGLVAAPKGAVGD